MLALTVERGRSRSISLNTVAGPSLSDGSVLVETVAVGLCRTDMEIIKGQYGSIGPAVALPPIYIRKLYRPKSIMRSRSLTTLKSYDH